VVLTPQRSAATVAIAIEPIAGHCVQERADGVSAGQVASVEVEPLAALSLPAPVAKSFTALRQVGPVQAAGNRVAPGHNGLPMVSGEGD
jgi:hypothetical protein